MIRISGIRLSINNKTNLLDIAKKTTGLQNIVSVELVKRSVDARSKHSLIFEYILDAKINDDENIYIKHSKYKNVEIVPETKFYKPLILSNKTSIHDRPIIIGTGPAGMLAGLVLASSGLKPILIERGKPVFDRLNDVETYWKTGKLNPQSNVQFGEGGAGTFSDGKLTTGVKKDEITKYVLKEFIEAGAPSEIMFLGKPHIGSDKLRTMVKNIREKIISLGGEYKFETTLNKIITKNDQIIAIQVKDKNNNISEISANNVILAIGHSSRDTFEMLKNCGISMEQKPFAVGVRIEHLQSFINKKQFGMEVSPAILKAADYKLATHIEYNNIKRGVYTFCMCPGGHVVAAASEKDTVVTNGMSYYARNNKNANSAILVEVGPQDFESNNVLAGVEFQRKIEKAAFVSGGKSSFAPIQKTIDFLVNKETSNLSSVKPSYLPGTTFADLRSVLPKQIVESLKLGLKEMNEKFPGFTGNDSILIAPETRSSSPVRIIRDPITLCSINTNGLYPCGEGAGYAGGIMSAAMDGVRCADAIIKKLS
ncbi:MAG: hypothetical protein MJ247_06270 [Alphaproteobacteria bacterium]|nr:hypothetical protein [Alphaproteobacteria bacterium]